MIIEKYFGIEREIVQQMIDETKTMTYDKTGDNGFQNTKTFLFDEYAVLKSQNINVRNVDTQDTDLKHYESIANTLLDLHKQGVNVVPILAFQVNDDGNGYIIQQRAKGTEVYDREKIRSGDKNYILKRVELLSGAPQEHFDKFVADTIKIIDAGVIVDFVGKDNFIYHETIGFQFIDLNAHDDYEYGLSDEKSQGKRVALYCCFLPCYYVSCHRNSLPKYSDSVSTILPELTDNERDFLKKHNKNIFKKCKTAAINNGIPEEAISEMISNEWFIPQSNN
jgi:hypothetical protein